MPARGIIVMPSWTIKPGSLDSNRIHLLDLAVSCATNKQATASLKIKFDNEERANTFSSQDGPVDAVFNAIKKIIPHSATLDLYQVQAVTEGTDAQATVMVRLKQNNRIFSAHGSDASVLTASALAYINCLEKLSR